MNIYWRIWLKIMWFRVAGDDIIKTHFINIVLFYWNKIDFPKTSEIFRDFNDRKVISFH